MGIGEILDAAIKLYRKNAWTLFRIVLVIVAPVTVLANLIQVSATPSDLSPHFGIAGLQTTNPNVTTHDVVTLVIGGLIAVTLTWIGSLVATGATFKALTEAFLGETPDWKRSLGYAGRRLHSLVWVSWLGALFTGLALIACILPGIYLAVGFTVAVPVLLSENLRGRKALGRSRRLVKGRWWGTFALVLLGAILTGIVNSALTALIVSVAAEGASANTVLGFTVTTIGTTAAKALTTPFTAAYVTVLYFDLRVRHEAFDLQLLALQVGVDPPEGGPGLLEPPPPPPTEQPPFWPPPPGWKPGGSLPG